MELQLNLFLILAIYKDESASGFACFIPVKRASDSHSIGGWIGLRAGLDVLEMRNIFILPDATRHVSRFGSLREEFLSSSLNLSTVS